LTEVLKSHAPASPPPSRAASPVVVRKTRSQKGKRARRSGGKGKEEEDAEEQEEDDDDDNGDDDDEEEGEGEEGEWQQVYEAEQAGPEMEEEALQLRQGLDVGEALERTVGKGAGVEGAVGELLRTVLLRFDNLEVNLERHSARTLQVLQTMQDGAKTEETAKATPQKKKKKLIHVTESREEKIFQESLGL
jgi:hypothetical protein